MAALVHCPQKKPTTLITVVMEAMPARATENLVDRLVFGDFGGGQRAGIEKLCDIFERFGARATFFVEYAATVLHGEEKIFKAAELLEKRGHDVQLHIHSEILVRKNLWPPQPEEEFPGWDGIDADIAQACAEFGVECFERNLGRKPRIFRPGGMKHSKALYDAVRTVGIEAVSALYSRYEQHLWPSIDKWPIFQWDNGLKEMPLDFALDPLVPRQLFQEEWDRIMQVRKARPAASLLIHSTSLLFRDLSGNPPHFTGYHKPYEEQLVQYLELCADQGVFLTCRDILDASDSLPVVKLAQLYPNEPSVALETQQTDAATAKRGTDSAQRQFTLTLPAHQATLDLDTLERIVPPTALPVKLAKGQRVELIEPAGTDDGASYRLAYIVTGHKAYILRQRAGLFGGKALEGTLPRIFARNPGVELIIAESILEDEPILNPLLKELGRKTFVLDIPASFEAYRNKHISVQLRKDIEREERRVNELLPGIRFKALYGTELDKESFVLAVELIESHLQRKVGDNNPDAAPVWSAADALAQWEAYRQHGIVFQLATADTVYAVTLCLNYGLDCYFMAAGHLEYVTKYSLGKILLYRLIEELVKLSTQRLHMGGGDFGYKSRFGAIERPLHNVHFAYASGEDFLTRVKRALEAGQSPAVLESDLGQPLEAILGEEFESLLGIDFEGGMENRRHQDQANSRNAFIKLMSSIPSGPNDVFVDVGCGTGKMLYYASQIGYRNCVGIEASEPLLHRAHGNLTRLRLQAEIKLSLCDTNRLAAGELSEGTVFYLSHPFTEVDLAGFLRNIAESQRIRPRTVRVVYYDSQYEAPFNPLGFRAIRSFETGNEGWIYDNSVIFEREPDATGTADSQHFILGVSMTSIDQTSDAIKAPADEFDVTHQVDTLGKIFLDDLTIVSGEKQTGAPVRQHNPIGSMPPCNTFLL